MNTTDSKAALSDIEFKRGGWWSNRTTFEKRLVVALGTVFLALIAIFIALIVLTAGVKEEVCLTEECVAAAARVSSMINKNVQPCHDFFEFACGTWRRDNVIPEDVSSHTMFGVLQDQLEVTVKGLLEREIESTEIDAVKKAKLFYESCMGTAIMDQRGSAPVTSLLSQFGGWPVLNSTWSEADFNLLDTLVELYKTGSSPLIHFYVFTDSKRSTARISHVDQPGFGMPGKKYYLRGRNDRMLKAYEDLIVKVAVLLGANKTRAVEDARSVVDFEIELANISVAEEDRRDHEKLYNPYTLRELSQNYSQFDWTQYVTRITKWGDVDVTQNEVIINYSPPYFTELFSLLNRIPARVQTNYLLWYLLAPHVSLLSEEFRSLVVEYNKVLHGTTSQRARFRQCTGTTTSYMGLAVGRLFIQETFDSRAKQTADDMIGGLSGAFSELLDELDWMDGLTKQSAREKAEFIDKKIAFPEQLFDDKYLNTFFANISLDSEKYFENIQHCKRESTWKELNRLREPVDRFEWISAPSRVNAYYSFSKNQIMFPAGILQPPFFSQGYPKSLNYGGIGVVIGHEITHGFDDRGRQYDKEGNLQQWWSSEAIEKFKSRAQCMVNQYSEYYFEEAKMNVNGINTQGENIADNAGLKQSFRAYRNWVDQRGSEEPKLPGLNFTNDQLFFINFAQIWCDKVRTESAVKEILTGVHSPHRFRVIGTLQNSPDFSRTFGCPKGSRMNPHREKCSVW